MMWRSCKLTLKYVLNCIRNSSVRQLYTNWQKPLERALSEALSERQEVYFTPCSTSYLLLGEPFSSSDLNFVIHPYYQDSDGKTVTPEDKTKHKNEDLVRYGIAFKNIFRNGFDEIAYICQTGSSHIDQFAPVAALLQFVSEMHRHTKSLRTMCVEDGPSRAMKMSESEISAILAVHIVSQLVYRSKYPCLISNDSKNKLPICPCGLCTEDVIYGNTTFGSEELWYGRPDIMAFPFGAGRVSVVVKRPKGQTEIDHIKSHSEHSDVEVKKCEDDYGLMDGDCISQISSQIAKTTITFSLFQKMFQKHKNVPESEMVSLIPTVALCAEGAEIYMYDTKYDIFLRNQCMLPFWVQGTESNEIDLNTIITLWMVFNHLSFKPSLPEKAIKILNGSCGFQREISSEKLAKIEKTIRMGKNIKLQNITKHQKLHDSLTILDDEGN